MSVVLLDMTGHFALQDAMKHFGVSEKTIRRWIQSGKLDAEKVDGRWQIHIDEFVDQPTGHVDQSNDRTTGQNDQTATLERLLAEKDARVQQLEAQLGRKDQQLDHLTQVVAMSQKNIAALTEQLDSSRQMIEDMRHRRTVWQRIKAVFVSESV